MGTFGRGNRGGSKMGAVVVERLRKDYEEGMTQRALGEKYGLSVVQVGRIVRGESWKGTGTARGFVAGEGVERTLEGLRASLERVQGEMVGKDGADILPEGWLLGGDDGE